MSAWDACAEIGSILYDLDIEPERERNEEHCPPGFLDNEGMPASALAMAVPIELGEKAAFPPPKTFDESGHQKRPNSDPLLLLNSLLKENDDD